MILPGISATARAPSRQLTRVRPLRERVQEQPGCLTAGGSRLSIEVKRDRARVEPRGRSTKGGRRHAPDRTPDRHHGAPCWWSTCRRSSWRPSRATETPVVANTVRLIQGGEVLNIPVWATEQYPQGLGPTVAGDRRADPGTADQADFHCCAVPQLLEQLYGRHIRHVTLAGIEAHVCVAQTALELLDLGFRVQVPADAVARGTRSTGSSPSAASNTPARSSRPPRPSSSNGSRPPTGPSSRRSARWSKPVS